MGKSSKKSNVAVAATPVVTQPKSEKKGKREAEKDTKKQASGKKPKLTQKHIPKKEETSSSEDTSSSEEENVKPAIKASVPAKKAIGSSVNNGSVQKKMSSSSESDSDSDSDEDIPAAAKKAVVTNEKESSSSSGSDSDEDVKPSVKAPPPAKKSAVPVKKDSSSSSESESDSDEAAPAKVVKSAVNGPSPALKRKQAGSSTDSSSDEDEVQAAKVPSQKAVNKKAEQSDSSDSESDSDGDNGESSESDGEPQTKKLKAPTTPVVAQEDSTSEEEDSSDESEDEKAKTPVTPKTTGSGSSTLFVGNLSFSIERENLEEFFKDAGEVVDVRFASNEDGRFRGFGHVQFATESAAKKALELNGQDLLGRPVRLDIAHERGPPGAAASRERSFEKSNKPTVFVKGFNKFIDEDQIRNNLQEHFGECGEISRISIPTDQESGAVRGFAYIDFTSTDSSDKALKLNGSELEGYTLTVDEPGQGGGGSRGVGRSGGRGFQDRGGRFGGGRSGGRFSDDRGGRFGGRRGGGRGGLGEGRGRGNRPSFGSAGKKTTFGDD